MKKILVINLARFGDILQSIPMIHGLKSKYPESFIAFMVNKEFIEVSKLVPFVDEIIALDFRIIQNSLLGNKPSFQEGFRYLKILFREIKEKDFADVINLTPHDIGVLSSYLSGDAESFWSQISDWSMYYLNITRHWKTLEFHLADLYKKIAGLSPDKNTPGMNITDESKVFAQSFLQSEGINNKKKIIGFHPGASGEEKQWPIEYFCNLENLISLDIRVPIVLFGSKADKQHAEFLKKNIKGHVVDAIGKTNPMELAALMSKMTLLVTNDTGPMHVAAACKTKILSLHMGKEKCHSTGPYGEGHICLQPKLNCHPCKSPENCSTRTCRIKITSDAAYEMVKFMLNGKHESSTKTVNNVFNGCSAFISRFDNMCLLDFYPLYQEELTFDIRLVIISKVNTSL